MAQFRKKPVIVDAVKVVDCVNNAARDWKALPEWLRAAYERGDIFFLPASIEINTLEGRMTAGPMDWIIRGVKGEIYPCKPDIFEATYEFVIP